MYEPLKRIFKSFATEGQQATPDALEATTPLAHPCWLVPIRTLIEICQRDGLLPNHEQLKADGALVEYQPGMPFIFLSHTCLYT